MEIDGGGSGGSGGAASGADVSASEAAAAAGRGAGGGAGGGPGGSEVEGKSTAEGEPKVKRKMKTAFQLETLEKTYAGLFMSTTILILISCYPSFFFKKKFKSFGGVFGLIYLPTVEIQIPFLDVLIV